MTTHMACRPFKRETNTSWPWTCVRVWCNDVWRHETHACIPTCALKCTRVAVSSRRNTTSDTCKNSGQNGWMTEGMDLKIITDLFSLVLYCIKFKSTQKEHLVACCPPIPHLTSSLLFVLLFFSVLLQWRSKQTGRVFNKVWLGVCCTCPQTLWMVSLMEGGSSRQMASLRALEFWLFLVCRTAAVTLCVILVCFFVVFCCFLLLFFCHFDEDSIICSNLDLE